MRSLRAIGLLACAALGTIHTWPTRCDADLTLTFTQNGSEVDESGSGTINTSALTNLTTGFSSPGMVPSSAFTIVGSSSSPSPINGWGGISGPASIGPGGFIVASSGTGQAFGIRFLRLSNHSKQHPVANELCLGLFPFRARRHFRASPLSTLGLTPGTYTYTWGAGVTADSLTVQINPVTTVSPEPPTWIMAVAGAGIAGVARWRRRRASR